LPAKLGFPFSRKLSALFSETSLDLPLVIPATGIVLISI